MDTPRSLPHAAKDVAAEVVHEWSDDEVSGRAAEIAFFALLSVFPGLLAFSAALSSLDRIVGQDLAGRVRNETISFLERVLTSEADTAIGAVEALFEQSNTGVFTVGVVAAVWSASRAMAAVVRGLDAAYDVEDDRSWLGTRVTALGLAVATLLVALLGTAMLVLGPLLGGGHEVADALGLGGGFATAWGWLRLPVTAALIVGWTAVVYHLAPSTRTGWRWHLPGAALMTAWAIVASAGLRLYLQSGWGGNEVFGVLGGALILLVWVYVLALGLLVGGELNAVLTRRVGAVQWRPAHDVGRQLRRVLRRAAVTLRSTRRAPPRRS